MYITFLTTVQFVSGTAGEKMCSRGKKIVQLCTTDSREDDDNSSDAPSISESVQQALESIVDVDSDDSVRDPTFEPENEINRKRSFVGETENEMSESEELQGEMLGIHQKKKHKGDTRQAREERKMKRNTGKEYTTRNNKTVPARSIKKLRSCRNKCMEKYTDEIRLQLFTEFWNMASYNRRAQYVSDLIELRDKKTIRIRSSDGDRKRNRTKTIVYYFSINGELNRTCKDCFRNTFDISNKFIEIQVNKKRATASGIIEEDRRGFHINRKKVSHEDKMLAQNHILSIPSYESHYTRKRSSKKYLPSYYTLASLYQAYKEKYPDNNIISRTLYEKIFHSLNIKIKKPKKDTCGTCDKFHMKIKMSKTEEEKKIVEKQLEVHHLQADEGYKAKERDKERSKEDNTIKTICFDLQQCLPTPDLQNGESFYKRLLWTYNLTVHDCDTSQAYCYLWYESLAKRGGNEIGSCVYMYLLKNVNNEVKHVTMYSDSCGGQNKNSFISAACFVVLQNSSNLEVIDHKFLLPGHTHMECDGDHSLIEKKKKKTNLEVEHPHDWAILIRQVGKKNPFIVTEMKRKGFLDFAGLFATDLTNRKHQDGEKINWREVRWLRYKKNEKTIFYKNSLDECEDFKSISFAKRGITTQKLLPKEAYNRPVQITQEKKQHLMDLLPYISESLWDFYKNLPSASNQVDVLSDDSTDEEN